jgi:uncharacterized protein (DUF885 family)
MDTGPGAPLLRGRAKYDIHKFHDAMLLPGAVPLELLEHTNREPPPD